MGQLSGCILNGCKKEVNDMACDESLYHQYLSGDDAGLEALMRKYGDPLTLYIDGYLHDVHEAEELMLDVFAYLFTKKPKVRDGHQTAQNGRGIPSVFRSAGKIPRHADFCP